MIKVEMIAHTNRDPLQLTSHAALKCYQSEDPKWGKEIDTENRLFKVGHHTTFQHWYATFSIENIAVGDVTLGLHLDHPFYNSDQRSGRYSKMFESPDWTRIDRYIKDNWPQLSRETTAEVLAYVKKGYAIYEENLPQAKKVSARFTEDERPFISPSEFERNYPKIAQEQMRMFIPIIFPTGLDFTINLTALAAMYRIAWTPAMRFVTQKMVDQIVKKYPNVTYMFSKDAVIGDDWGITLKRLQKIGLKYKPEHKLIRIVNEENFSLPDPEKMHPVDLLHFDPDMMDNNTGGLKSRIEISVATMGQDQRHRTLRRSKVKYTGNFYLPPIPRALKLYKEAIGYLGDWYKISAKVPDTLAMILAPYGAMVSYEKDGSFNAILHEQAKRLCWCAQEEIYHAGRALRLGIEKKKGKKSKLLQMFESPCFRTRKCAEGGRFCGRDIRLQGTGDYFPERKV